MSIKYAFRSWYRYRFLPWLDRRLLSIGMIRCSVHNRVVSSASDRVREAQRETELLKESLDRILPKLARVSWQHLSDRHLYRICLDMNEFTIREALQFGNDQGFIRCFGERVGMMAARELLTVNMQRFSEPPFNGSKV